MRAMTAKDLFEAIQKGEVEKVRAAVAGEPGLARVRNEQGVSAVLFARYCNRQEIVDELLRLEPELDIFEAAALNKRNRVAELLTTHLEQAKAYSPDGFTALHLACFFGHPNLAEMLLRYGADPNARSRNGMSVTPLHSAAAARKQRTVEWLVDYGADVNATQQGGWAALHEAARQGNIEMTEYLLSKGANPALRSEDGKAPADLAQEKGHLQALAALKAHA
ncbi:MAG TPA: ankyrin repeat domain-containing protein [Terriglobales bacterium]|nr:ankyrin repeat domain-containing protein [Terriglobales bacterium]